MPEKHRKVVHPYAKEALVVAGPSGDDNRAGAKVQPVAKEEDEVIWRLATAGGDNTIRVSWCEGLMFGLEGRAGQVRG